MTDASAQPAAPTLEEVLGAYGEVETQALGRIQAFTAKAMTRSWTTIPHVFHHDRIDVTALEATRQQSNEERPAGGRLTPLPYLLKAVAGVLRRLPRFNAALDEAKRQIILRRYCNLGIAIDTQAGLVVGVIRACDRLSLEELGAEAKALSEQARGKGLSLAQMSGGCFTLSSLGPLGGDGFTPIINAPEVAILGISRVDETPTRGADGGIEWRKLLPVTLSYDHRVVNGADAGRFMHALQAEVDALAGGKA
jgi:pyruvate dehydrogenase E2 component (dihydrolipoamide acetyltransferase)